MSIADNGDAIICGHIVRRDGVNILRTLASFSEAVGVPDLVKHVVPHHSSNHLNTVLGRLLKLPGLVTKEERLIAVGNTKTRRVLWQVTPAVNEFFST